MHFSIPNTLPITALALLGGICCTMFLPQMPSLAWMYVIIAACCTLLFVQPNHPLRIIAIAGLGLSLMVFHFHQHQSHALPAKIDREKITVIGTISSVVEDSKKPKSKFIFEIKNIEGKDYGWKLPASVQLTWHHAKKSLQPGDSWKLKIKVKPPRNYANPGSFDAEKFYFQQRIVGLGYVIDAKENRLLQPNILSRPINNLRQHILRVMHACMPNQEFASIIVSLVLGIKGDLPAEQIEVLQNTGTAHLLAISGLHIGMLASMCFVIFRWLWRYVPSTWLFIPAPWLAACGALIVSIMYALLAGFGIATQRALIMVMVFLAGVLFKRKTSTTHSFCLALLLVLLWDPFAVLALGFWYSFLAVAFLIYAQRSSSHWLRPQLLIAIALLPLNLLFFGKNSLIAPIANSIAIPWVGLAVLPLSLLAVVMLPFLPDVSSMLWNIAAQNFAFLWPLLSKLALLPTYTWQLPLENLSIIILFAILGAIWLFMPRGLPGRWWGILGIMPLFFIVPQSIPKGQADFTLLDVGQGLATVIRTQNHVLVYDTGAKLTEKFDLGASVVVPYLQSIGVKKIDTLMISHADNDHVGGAVSLLRIFPAQTIITSDIEKLIHYQPIACFAGQQWEWDGVKFTVMHPNLDALYKKRNDQSCVLMIQAGEHKVLLTGDIEKRSEKQLISSYGEDLRADLMLVPHHGSKTSSSIEFLQTVNPKYALIPVGYQNRYGHPKQAVLQRYQDLGIAILRTEQDGAINFRLGGDLMPHCYRREQRGFWLAKSE